MKTTIEQTNWSSLRHATGTCEHVPEAILDLLSADQKTRQAAYWKLDNYVVLQGDLYEAAPYLARALVEILPEATAGKDRIYDLLVELANGDAPESMKVVMDGNTLPVKEATVKALVTGLPNYRRDSTSESPIIRRRVFELLLAVSEEVKLDPEDLRLLEQNEPDETVRELIRELRELSQ